MNKIYYNYLHKIFQLSALFCLLFYVLAAIHIFFSHAKSAPVFTLDESLANVSFSMAELNRYGTQSIPLLDATNKPQFHDYFNYGPAYYLYGAGLTWLFGFSLVLLRFIHLLSIIFICVLALFFFLRKSVSVGCVFSVYALYMYCHHHWPIIRCDTFCSVFAFLGLVCTGYAIRKISITAWFGAFFFTANAFFQHPITLPLLPALVAVWIVWFLSNKSKTDSWWKPDRRDMASFLAGLSGLVLALFLFMVLIDFRIFDIFEIYGNVKSIYHTKGPSDMNAFQAYTSHLSNHLRYAWGESNTAKWFSFVQYFVGLTVVALMMRKNKPNWDCIAYLAPPTFFGLCYQLGIGFYPNSFAGYAILIQLMVGWTSAAFLALTIGAIKKRFASWDRPIESVLCLGIAGVALITALNSLKQPNNWQHMERQNTNFISYYNHVIDPLPLKAKVWGSGMFGMESSLRIELIKFPQGVFLAKHFPIEERLRHAPDYLILGHDEVRYYTDFLLRGDEDSLLENRDELSGFHYRYLALKEAVTVFPAWDYRLTGQVLTKTYGLTRIYSKTSIARDGQYIAYNNGESPQWWHTVEGDIDFDFTRCDPVTIDIRSSSPFAMTANYSLKTDIEAGVYSLDVTVNDSSTDMYGLIIVTPDSPHRTSYTLTGYDFISVPYFPGESPLRFLVDHPGGTMFISQFSSSTDVSFHVAKVQRVTGMEIDHDSNYQQIPIPSLTKWIPYTQSGAIVESVDKNSLRMRSDLTQWGYQVSSPAIPVPSDMDFELSLPLEVLQGCVGIGILDAKGQWLKTPVQGKREIAFHSGPSKYITIVVSNNYYIPPEIPSQFILKMGSLFNFGDPDISYVDRLSAPYLKLE